MTPEPIAEEREEEEEVKTEDVREVIEDGGVVVAEPKKEETLSTLLKIDPADLEAVKAFLDSRSGSHVVLQTNAGSITAEERL